jgi:hypothetical protein
MSGRLHGANCPSDGRTFANLGRGENDMSNTRAWRAKQRTAWPNARQKRNGLFLDAHPKCQKCRKRRSREAHHELPKGHPARYDWKFMKALCVPCHLKVHQIAAMVVMLISRRR